jgi:hypothetical protein
MQPRHQPEARDGGGGADRHLLRRGVPQGARRARHAGEGGGHRVVEGLPLLRQFDPSVEAMEERAFEPFLQPAHLAADRGRGHVQLAGRLLEAEPAGGRLEGGDGAQRRQVVGALLHYLKLPERCKFVSFTRKPIPYESRAIGSEAALCQEYWEVQRP